IEKAGMEIREDKIQYTKPWTYLGVQIRERTIVPQQITRNDDPKTLRDLHSLCGSINWVRPLFGITTEDLAPLFNLLCGPKDLDSPCTLTEEARGAITKVQEALRNKEKQKIQAKLPFSLIILNLARQPHALIFQWDPKAPDPLLITEWIFLPHQMSKTVSTQQMFALLMVKARQRLITLAGVDFCLISLPITTVYLQMLLQQSEVFQMALTDFSEQLSTHLLKHKLVATGFNL
ncbi:POK11 protein, partial [Molothrus ater]|nr:POK11 protein [Molothrus ater]